MLQTIINGVDIRDATLAHRSSLMQPHDATMVTEVRGNCTKSEIGILKETLVSLFFFYGTKHKQYCLFVKPEIRLMVQSIISTVAA